jgi:hypothetical protein
MENRDEELWKLAEARVGFKRHFTTYLTVNIFVWLIWYFTGSRGSSYGEVFLPWPAWMTFGWGIGILFHFFGVYVNKGYNSVEREYEKLKKKK